MTAPDLIVAVARELLVQQAHDFSVVEGQRLIPACYDLAERFYAEGLSRGHIVETDQEGSRP